MKLNTKIKLGVENKRMYMAKGTVSSCLCIATVLLKNVPNLPFIFSKGKSPSCYQCQYILRVSGDEDLCDYLYSTLHSALSEIVSLFFLDTREHLSTVERGLENCPLHVVIFPYPLPPPSLLKPRPEKPSGFEIPLGAVTRRRELIDHARKSPVVYTSD